jgi:hypothetical protein
LKRTDERPFEFVLASTANDPAARHFDHAASDHDLEQDSRQIAVTEAAMPKIGECRVVRYVAVEAEASMSSKS